MSLRYLLRGPISYIDDVRKNCKEPETNVGFVVGAQRDDRFTITTLSATSR